MLKKYDESFELLPVLPAGSWPLGVPTTRYQLAIMMRAIVLPSLSLSLLLSFGI